MLVSGGMDSKVMLWDVASKQRLGEALDARGRVRSVAFSPDSRLLAAGGDDSGGDESTLILWDTATRQRIGELAGHGSLVTGLAFSPNGAILASSSLDTTVILWDVSLDSWQQRACRIVHRNLTPAEWHQYLGDEPYRETCPPDRD